MAPGFAADIDWRRPWLAPYAALADGAQHATSAAEALNKMAVAPVHFVPQSALPAGMAYEQFVSTTGTVPTRDNLHDFFNGLCWMRFPATKARLNVMQAAEIDRGGIRQLRGPVRDALTLFDENAAFLFGPQPLWDALIARDWPLLFIGLRPLWKEAQVVLFGHALLEKLVLPRKPITAHVYVARPPMKSIAELDEWIAAGLVATELAGKPFAPLPVLGIPGWWSDNENFSFYDDSQVFRTRR